MLTLNSPPYRVPQPEHPEVSEGPGAGAGQTLAPVPPDVIIIIIMTRQVAGTGYQGQVAASLNKGGSQR